MHYKNKLHVLTNTEREFINSSKKDRTKKHFKNPTVIKNRLKEKSKNLLSTIPSIIQDFDLLYKFAVEVGADYCVDFNDLTIGDIKEIYEKMPILLKFDFSSFIGDPPEFFNSMDAKKMLFLTVSSLYWNVPAEYEEITKKTCDDIKDTHNYAISTIENQAPRISKMLSDLKIHVNKNASIKVLDSLTPNKKQVALSIFLSKNGLTKNGIAEKTGFDKRFVTRYTNELQKDGIIKTHIVEGSKKYKNEIFCWNVWC